MVNKAALWTDVFWISSTKCYKFYNNKLLVVLGSQQVGTLELGEPQKRGLSIYSIADSLGLNLLGHFAEVLSYFSMKTNRRKVRKCIRCVKEFFA